VEVAQRRGVDTRKVAEAFAGVEARCGVPNSGGLLRAASIDCPLALGVESLMWRIGEEAVLAQRGEAAMGEAAAKASGCRLDAPFKLPAGTCIYWDVRRLWINFDAVAMDNVEKEVVRSRKRGLTQKISAIPQPGLKYSHKHLLRTLWRRSDSSRLLVCSFRNNLFNDERDVFNNRADFRPCTEGFSCSFSAPARSTRVRAPIVLLMPPPQPTSRDGFCTKMWTMAWDLDELELQDETPAERFTRAS
jgi:hypothetical protein